MTDIVERLRKFDREEIPAELYPYNPKAKIRPLILEAADKIERLLAALKKYGDQAALDAPDMFIEQPKPAKQEALEL